MARHVKKGDTVMVTAGNDSGKVGEVLRVIPDENRVVVQGVNIRTRHMKPTQQNPQGGLLRKEMPIHISNVSPAVGRPAARGRGAPQAGRAQGPRGGPAAVGEAIPLFYCLPGGGGAAVPGPVRDEG
ncbi:MAG: 50S ribosomal protein L24 [Phycisphaerales bacterium]|nr:50S ribosomal protein L24 [Phycisphaerales bacterium]